MAPGPFLGFLVRSRYMFRAGFFAPSATSLLEATAADTTGELVFQAHDGHYSLIAHPF